MTEQTLDPIPIGAARSNLTEVASEVRHRQAGRVLTHRGRPEAALVPMSLWEAIQAVGGVAAATELLRKAAETASG